MAENDAKARALRLIAATNPKDLELFRAELDLVAGELAEGNDWDVFGTRAMELVDALAWAGGTLIGALERCGLDRAEMLKMVDDALIDRPAA